MDTFEVKAVNVICGNNNDKVKVCHKNKNSLCISSSAVEAHLTNHDDHLGNCGIDPCGDGILTGLKETFEKGNFKIHPNPANDLLIVEIPEFSAEMELQIFGINGQVVKNQKVTSNTFYVSIADLEVGIYQISITNSNSSWVQKLVVIR
jgi:hypothetical protein